MSLDTVNDRLLISSNGVGTAHFDPRPCVVKFLSETDAKAIQIQTFMPHDFTLASFVNSRPYRSPGKLWV